MLLVVNDTPRFDSTLISVTFDSVWHHQFGFIKDGDDNDGDGDDGDDGDDDEEEEEEEEEEHDKDKRDKEDEEDDVEDKETVLKSPTRNSGRGARIIRFFISSCSIHEEDDDDDDDEDGEEKEEEAESNNARCNCSRKLLTLH